MFEMQLVDLVRAEDGRVSGVRLKDGQDRERQVSAELVIGADGVRSTVARLVGSECYRTGRHATGVVFSYWSGPGFDGYHWYYNPGVSVGAIPTNDGLTCIFASVPQRRFHGINPLELGVWIPPFGLSCSTAMKGSCGLGAFIPTAVHPPCSLRPAASPDRAARRRVSSPRSRVPRRHFQVIKPPYGVDWIQFATRDSRELPRGPAQ